MVKQPVLLCDKNNQQGHHWHQISKYVWTCLYCGSPIWLPLTFNEAMVYSELIKRKGKDQAFSIITKLTPSSIELMECIALVQTIKEQFTVEEYKSKCIEIFRSFKDKTEQDHIITKQDKGKVRVYKEVTSNWNE